MAVPLHWQGTLTGLLLIGPERTEEPYTPEDLEFLATVGEQAAGAIVTARLSESLAQSREFEAFHRSRGTRRGRILAAANGGGGA